MFNIPCGSDENYGACEIAAAPVFRSLRFRSSSHLMRRTFQSGGNTLKWTASFWVKRAGFGHAVFLAAPVVAGTSEHYLGIGSGDAIIMWNGASGVPWFQSGALLRDPNAWYHVVFGFDTTQAVAANRCYIAVNGVKVPLVSNNTAQNQGSMLNTASFHGLGCSPTGSTSPNQSLAEVNFVDGEMKQPTDFGFFCPATGQWLPKTYTGGYGVTGFHLDYNAGSTLAALGTDVSGNGNNFTSTGFILNNTQLQDWVQDGPADNGATWNSVLPISGTYHNSTDFTSLTAYGSSGNYPHIGFPMTQGKYYCELVNYGGGASAAQTSYYICALSSVLSNIRTTSLGTTGYTGDGRIFVDGVQVASGLAVATTGVVVGLAIDADAATVQVLINGVSQGVYPLSLTRERSWVVAAFDVNDGQTTSFTFNGGHKPYAYPAPAGFLPMRAKSIPTPKIIKPARYFDIVAANGPDLLAAVNLCPVERKSLRWLKNRVAPGNHVMLDQARGDASALFLNLLDAVTPTPTLPANQHIAWVFGADPRPGFNVVPFNKTTGVQAIPHGLGAAPVAIWVKRLDASGWWYGFFRDVPGSPGGGLFPNDQSGFATGNYWGGVNPDDNVFTVGSDIPNGNYVAYVWANVPGFSQSSYFVGNGSADGPMITTGFRPKMLLAKSTVNNSDWALYDSLRSPVNPITSQFYTNYTDAEFTSSTPVDFLANGFKWRGTTYNVSGRGYMYMAFAEHPFKFANGR